MSSGLGETFALDIVLIFVLLFLLLSSANFLGMTKEESLTRYLRKRGLDAGQTRAFRAWRAAGLIGAVVLAFGWIITSAVIVTSASEAPSLEVTLLILALYDAAFLSFASYRFFDRVSQRLASTSAE